MPAQPETPTPSPAATPPPSPLPAKVQKTLELSEDAGDTLEVPRDEEPRPTLGAATFEAPVPAPPKAKEAPKAKGGFLLFGGLRPFPVLGRLRAVGGYAGDFGAKRTAARRLRRCRDDKHRNACQDGKARAACKCIRSRHA